MNPKKRLPRKNETLRTKLPDTFDGIRFELGRMVKYVQEGCKDPEAITLAQKISELASDTARQLGTAYDNDTRTLVWLEGIHAWCHANFEHVSNPPNIQVIKSPGRMLRDLRIPDALSSAMWEPIRDQMAKRAGKPPAELKLPHPKVTGSSAVASVLALVLAGAVGITPLRFTFGGHDGSLFYVWGSAYAKDRWNDIDILLPDFGTQRQFEHQESVEVPL